MKTQEHERLVEEAATILKKIEDRHRTLLVTKGASHPINDAQGQPRYCLNGFGQLMHACSDQPAILRDLLPQDLKAITPQLRAYYWAITQ